MKTWLTAEWASFVAFFADNGWVIARNIVLIGLIAFATGPIARRADHLINAAFLRFQSQKKDSLHDKRAATIGTMVGSLARYALWGVGVAVCLSLLGLSAEASALITTAGVSGGLLVGFGAQKLMQDFFAGFMFVTDHPFSVGDLVAIDGKTGVVEKVKLRTTTLRAGTGERYIFPNGSIGAVTNLSVNDALAACDIYVPTRHKLQTLRPLLLAAAERAVKDNENVVEPPAVVGITAITDRGMMCVRTTCRAKPLTHWEIERRMREEQLAALVDAEIL